MTFLDELKRAKGSAFLKEDNQIGVEFWKLTSSVLRLVGLPNGGWRFARRDKLPLEDGEVLFADVIGINRECSYARASIIIDLDNDQLIIDSTAIIQNDRPSQVEIEGVVVYPLMTGNDTIPVLKERMLTKASFVRSRSTAAPFDIQ